MGKSSQVKATVTIQSSNIIPVGVNLQAAMTVTASDDTSEFGKMVTSTAYERITKSATADRLFTYVKNVSSTSTVIVYLSMDILSNSSTNSHADHTHNGPRFIELAVGEWVCMPYHDKDGTDTTSKGIFVSSSAAGEIEYLVCEMD